MIVVDTNIIAYLYLTSDRSAQVERLLEKDAGWSAPLLWRSEFRNVLAFYIQRDYLSLEEAQAILRQALMLMKGREYEVASFQVMELVASSECSAYDCEFVALAGDLGIPLVTADKKILKAFPQISVSLDDYVDK
jgi:predicted nucleic acid-binding protein